jgi:hypothetical protein
MYEALNNSIPKELKVNQWHIPFGNSMDENRINDISLQTNISVDDIKLKIATARCARVSYLNFEGKDDYLADCNLHDTLSTSGHFSPMEHCALALYNDMIILSNGNLRGFIQYRKSFENENRTQEVKIF